MAVSERARAIAAGLTRSGRATAATFVAGYLCMPCLVGARDEFYWVRSDGRKVLRGRTRDTAEELQPGFVEAMARAGHLFGVAVRTEDDPSP